MIDNSQIFAWDNYDDNPQDAIGVDTTATQKDAEGSETGFVPVVVLTHPAPARAVDAALAEILEAGIVNERPVKLRML